MKGLRQSRMRVRNGATADRRARSAPPAKDRGPCQRTSRGWSASRLDEPSSPRAVLQAATALSKEQNLLAGPDGPLFHVDCRAQFGGGPERGTATNARDAHAR